MGNNRICFVSPAAYGYFNREAYEKTGGGGAKRQIYLLSQELRSDFEVSVVVGDYGQSRLECRDGVELYRAYKVQEGNILKKLIKLYRAMEQANADIYLSRGNLRKASATALLTRLLRGDWVYHVANDSNLGYNYAEASSFIRWGFCHGLKKAHAVVSQTTYQQKILREKFDIDSIVIPNGYPLPCTSPPVDREFILWVGRLEPRQNRPNLFLDCAEDLPHISFKLIGTPEDETCARKTRNRCKSLKNAEFLGVVPPDQIHEYYRHAVALVNTSKHEGFPNTFLEAWRQRTPVLSLSVDPGRFLNDEIYSGYANDDIDQLKHEIERLTANPERCAQVGHDLHDHFCDNYDIKEVAKKYKAIL